MTNIPEFMKLKATKYFPFEMRVACTRIKNDRKFTHAMAVVDIFDPFPGSSRANYTYLGEGTTSRSPWDRENQDVADNIAYARALKDALDQHINYLKHGNDADNNKENCKCHS